MLISAVLIYFISEIVFATERRTYKGIEELEKEKKDLFKQINEAIDDSVKSLQKVNDSDTLIGLKYMKDLKEHMKRVNVTVMNINHTVKDETFKVETDNRRRLKQMFNSSKFNTKRTSPKDIFDFEAVLRPNKVSATEWKDILENRQKMQNEIQKWALEKQKEKDRLKQYKLKKKQMLISGVYEKCPRFGYKGRKKKEVVKGDKKEHCKGKISDFDGTNNCTNSKEDVNQRRTKPSRKKNYPCCRKCCKKSYLGCL